MLDPVAVVSAILAVPPAIQAVRDIVAHKAPALASQIEKPLGDVEQYLLRFADIGDLFSEAKSYHEKLTQIDLAMSELLEAVAVPMRRGGFDADEFDRDVIFSRWRVLRDTKEFLPSLTHFLQTTRQLADTPLVLNETGVPIAGPQEFQDFVLYRIGIDTLIRQYNNRLPLDKERICDKIDEFSHHLRHQILSADTIIIRNALALAHALSELKKMMGNYNVS